MACTLVNRCEGAPSELDRSNRSSIWWLGSGDGRGCSRIDSSARNLSPNLASLFFRYTTCCGGPVGTRSDFDSESMRSGGRQPADHLQLALIRQDRIRSYSRRLSPDFRRYAPAESGQQQSSGGPRGELHKLIFLEGSSSGRALGDRKRGAEPAAAATATV